MKAVALTGLYGSGKSSVLKFVRSSRVPVVDSDRIVASLYRDPAVKRRLSGLFGTSSRKEISGIVFSSRAKRKKLEALLHPPAWKLIRKRLASFRRRGKSLCFVEVPLLFEAGWHKKFDTVVVVKCPKKTCLERLARKGVSRKDALARMRAQLSQGKKVKKAHYTIDNGGSLAGTRRQAGLLVEELLSLDG